MLAHVATLAVPGESDGQRMMPLLSLSLVLLIGVVSRRHRFCATQWLALTAGGLGASRLAGRRAPRLVAARFMHDSARSKGLAA